MKKVRDIFTSISIHLQSDGEILTLTLSSPLGNVGSELVGEEAEAKMKALSDNPVVKEFDMNRETGTITVSLRIALIVALAPEDVLEKITTYLDKVEVLADESKDSQKDDQSIWALEGEPLGFIL